MNGHLLITFVEIVVRIFDLSFISNFHGNSDDVTLVKTISEPRHDKTNKMSVCPAKTQIICQV